MRRSTDLLSFVPLVVCLVLLAGCVAAPTDPIDGFFEDFTAEWVRRNPNLAVRTQFFDGEEQERLSRELTPVTDAWSRDLIELARQGLEELATFDVDSMTASQRVSVSVMQWQLQSRIDSEPFLDYDFPLQQMNGVNVSLPNELAVAHPIRTEQDAVNYLARLEQVDARMSEAVEKNERLAALGRVPPRFILDATIAQMRQFVTPPAADNPLVAALATKVQDVPEISRERRESLQGEAMRIVETEVYPAWQQAVAVLESQSPRATDDAGLWRFEDGQDIYAQRLRNFTTTSLTAEDIHQIGLDEVARIEAEMDGLLQQLGYTDGPITERVAQLRADQSYPDSNEGRARIMADIDGILADALERTTALFDLRPDTPVIAQAYPEFRWANAAASYTAPPPDGSRPGIFQMPLRPSRLTTFSLRSLVYHETVPGHHCQIALTVENSNLPAFRQIRALGGISASSEGWALYAERLAAEAGWYEDDPAGRIGQLDSALFRARRLVVDTGLHAMGWTRQQAIDFGIEASEVERYVVYPGQACSYMIGQLKLVELRERAREALGDAFSNRQFHNVVLGAGVVPLTVLEQEVDAYITAAVG